MYPIESDYFQQLFRDLFPKLVAIITRLIGLDHLEVAEDIVSDSFVKAMEKWPAAGVPKNPAGWLYQIARHSAYKYIRRKKLFEIKIAPEISAGQNGLYHPYDEFSFSQIIADSQLQMMFAICNPVIANEAQIGLALRILGGFSIEEIADAFLTNKETINKRLYRAREKLRAEKVKMEMPPESELGARLNNVLHIIYLFFNEGYYSATSNETLRKDLCVEALRLGIMLTENKRTDLPKTNALVALMCYHASRFNARSGVDNSPILYSLQNQTLWDLALINHGNEYLRKSAQGEELTSYHLEARIAYAHSGQFEINGKWETIINLYDRLLEINHTPIAYLNRVYAIYKLKGRAAALKELEKIGVIHHHFYFTLLGELYKMSDRAKADSYFLKAIALAKTQKEKDIITQKLSQQQSVL